MIKCGCRFRPSSARHTASGRERHEVVAKILIAATSTPLASIFGNGFLVIAPILAGVVG